MEIALSPETQRLLDQQLQSGKYANPDQVVHAALEALVEIKAVELDEATLDAIDRAEDQIERGEYREWRDVREKVRNKFLGK